MAASNLTILVLGGAGAQNSAVVRGLSKNESFSIKVLSRDVTSEQCLELARLRNVTLIEGDCYHEETLLKAMEGVDGCFVNTNGMAIGEKSEIYWGIRMYELAHHSGIKHYVYSSLPYVSKKSGFNPKYYVPFVDGKAKICEYLRAQPTHEMNWTLLESGPYAEDHLARWYPSKDKDGVWVFRNPMGKNGAQAFVYLEDFGWFARYVFEHPKEFEGDLLSVGIDHVSGEDLAKAFTAVTGEPCRFEPSDLKETARTWPTAKVGRAGAGYDDPTLRDPAGHLVPWYTIWSESGGNRGLWTRDYGRLDKIYPGRVKTIEQWMRVYDYPTRKVSVLKDKPLTVVKPSS